MTTSLCAALAALSLSQAPAVGPAAPVAAPPAAPAALPTGLVPPGAPALRADRPIRCLYGPSGAFRAQCDDAARRCLVAPDAVLDEDGRPAGPLERSAPCSTPAIREADVAGWTLVPALAETPPGYRRDERQRLSQVAFDLARRAWLGGGWAAGGQPWQPQAVASSGVRFDLPFTWGGAAALARLRALDGWAAVDGSAAEIGGVTVDLARAYPRPLFYLTTFVGPPRRFDLPLYAGLWAEALRFETLRTRTGDRYERTMAGAAAVTFDVWRTADLAGYVRLRAGGGYEQVSGHGGADWTVAAVLEGDAALDADGLTHLRGSVGSEVVLADRAAPPAPLASTRWRHHLRAEAERIVFSVNDQPVSAVLALRAGRRDDVPDWPAGWTGEATVQLRFSLGAPALTHGAAPRPAPTPDAARP